MMRTKRGWKMTVGAVLGIALVGCSDSTGPTVGNAPLELRVDRTGYLLGQTANITLENPDRIPLSGGIVCTFLGMALQREAGEEWVEETRQLPGEDGRIESCVHTDASSGDWWNEEAMARTVRVGSPIFRNGERYRLFLEVERMELNGARADSVISEPFTIGVIP